MKETIGNKKTIMEEKMEIIEEYGNFYKDIKNMGINCFADNGEVFFAIPGVDVTEDNNREIYKTCINKINELYNITVMSITVFVKNGISYIKIITQ